MRTSLKSHFTRLGPCPCLTTSKVVLLPDRNQQREASHSPVSSMKYFHSTDSSALMSHAANKAHRPVPPMFTVTVLITHPHSELQLQPLSRAMPGHSMLSSNSYTFSRFHRPARVPTCWTHTSAILTSLLMCIRHWAVCFITEKSSTTSEVYRGK